MSAIFSLNVSTGTAAQHYMDQSSARLKQGSENISVKIRNSQDTVSLSSTGFSDSPVEKLTAKIDLVRQAKDNITEAGKEVENLAGLVDKGQKIQKSIDSLAASPAAAGSSGLGQNVVAAIGRAVSQSLIKQRDNVQKKIDASVQKIKDLGRPVDTHGDPTDLSHSTQETSPNTLAFGTYNLGHTEATTYEAKSSSNAQSKEVSHTMSYDLSSFSSGGRLALGSTDEKNADREALTKEVLDKASGDVSRLQVAADRMKNTLDSQRQQQISNEQAQHGKQEFNALQAEASYGTPGISKYTGISTAMTNAAVSQMQQISSMVR